MGNKSDEKDCINKVLKYSKSQHGKSKRIINMLNGIVKDSERPDFIAETTDINGEQIVLGIENLQIDGVCIKKKNGKYAGTEQKRLKDTKAIFDKYKDKVVNNDFISEEAFKCATDEILNVANKTVEYSFNATYKDFVKVFEEKLTSHAKSIDVYYDTINKYSEGLKKSKLMFLINVVGNFNGLFLNSNNKVNQITIDEIPLFSDIVNLLDTIVGNKIDYIVLCLGNGDKTKVIALDAKNIFGELKRQNIKIYKYFCYDYLLPFMTQSRCSYEIVEMNKEEVKVNFECTGNQLNTEALKILCYYCYYFCYQARRKKECFVTNNVIQLLLDVFSKYLSNWKVYIEGKAKLYYPIFDIKNTEILKQDITAFEKLWSINDD